MLYDCITSTCSYCNTTQILNLNALCKHANFVGKPRDGAIGHEPRSIGATKSALGINGEHNSHVLEGEKCVVPRGCPRLDHPGNMTRALSLELQDGRPVLEARASIADDGN